MSKLAIVAAILPAAAWWWTTNFAPAPISEPGAYAFYHTRDLPSESCLVKSAAHLVSRPMTRASQPTSRIGTSLCMTEYLVAARAAIVLWTNLAVMPAEILFDAIGAA
jgi:hypothetical protein